MGQIDGNVKVNVNANQAINEIKKLDQKASELRQEIIKIRKEKIMDRKQISLLSKELKSVEKTQRQLRQSAVNYKTVLNNLSGASLKDLNKAYRQLSFEVNKLDRNTKEWKLKAEQMGRVKSEISSVRAKMRAMDTTVQKSKKGIGGLADKFNKFGSMALGAIAGITATITGLVVVVKKLANTMMEFEDSFTDVLTLLNADQIAEFGQELEQGSIDTMKKYGLEISDVNKALFDTISAGVAAGDAIGVLDAASILAKGGTTSLSVATDGLTTVMNAFHLSTEEATDVANAFFTAQKYGKTTVEQLAQNVGTVAPIMNAAGLSYQEMLAVLAELTKNGISTAESTTYLKGAITGLLKPTAEASKILKQYGVPVGAMEIKQAGLTKTLAAFNDMMAKNPDVVAKAMPNIRGLTGIMALSGSSFEDFQVILDQVNNDLGDGSSLMQAYGIKAGTASAQMDKAKASLNASIIALKDKLLPVFTKVVIFISKISNSLKRLIIQVQKTGNQQKSWVVLLKTLGKILTTLYKSILKPIIEAFINIFTTTNDNNIIMNTLIATLKILEGALKLIGFFLKPLLDLFVSLNNAVPLFNTNISNTTRNLNKLKSVDTTHLDKFGKKVDYINEMLKENIILVNEQGKIISSKIAIYDESGKVLTNLSIAHDKFSGKIRKETKIYDQYGKEIEYANLRFSDSITAISDNIENLETNALSFDNFIDKFIGDFHAWTNQIDTFFGNIDKHIDKILHPDQYTGTTAVNSTFQITNPRKFGDTHQSTEKKQNNDDTNNNVIPPIIDENITPKKDDTKELANYIKNIRKDLLIDAEEKALAEVEIWREKEQQKIKAMVAGAKKKNEALKLIEEQYQKKIDDIDSSYAKKRNKRIQDIVSFIQKKELELHGTREQFMLNDISNIELKYDTEIALAQKLADENVDIREDMLNHIQQLELLKLEEIENYKLQKEEAFQQAIQQTRQKYGLETETERLQLELDQLQNAYDQKLLSEEEFQIAKNAIIQKYQNKQEDVRINIEKKKKEALVEGLQNSIAAIEAVGTFLQTQKEQELAVIGDNEAKKKAIMKRYADKEMIVTMSKIIASTALAVTQALTLGPIAGPIAATAIGLTGAMQLQNAKNERDRILGLAQGGMYQREQDGKIFHAEKSHQRGLISKPSVLVAEEGPEYVVPNEGLQNPSIMNFLSMIESARVNGRLREFRMPKVQAYADGGVIGSAPSPATSNFSSEELSEVIQKIDLLISVTSEMYTKIDNWANSLKVDYYSFRKTDETIKKIETKADL